MLQNKNKQFPDVQAKQKNAKLKMFMKNTPSKLYHIQQCRGVLRSLSNI